VFRLSLEQADSLRTMLIFWARQWPATDWLIPVVVTATLVMTAY
jgi:hypothetical protein